MYSISPGAYSTCFFCVSDVSIRGSAIYRNCAAMLHAEPNGKCSSLQHIISEVFIIGPLVRRAVRRIAVVQLVQLFRRTSPSSHKLQQQQHISVITSNELLSNCNCSVIARYLNGPESNVQNGPQSWPSNIAAVP